MERPKIKRLRDAALSEQLQNSQARYQLGEIFDLDNCQVCKKPVWISCFFDGTGNNFELDGGNSVDPRDTKHSNIAKLSWFAHPGVKDDKPRVFNFYAPGVGTPFPEVGDSGQNINKAIGMANAGYGQARLDWMYGKIKTVIDKHTPHISQVNIAIFGFSRGAALARAFVHQLNKTCGQIGDDLVWTMSANGEPPKLVIYYLGLLDTVASAGYGGSRIESRLRRLGPVMLGPIIGGIAGIGLADADAGGHYGWAQDISIPSNVLHCDHFMAAHEVREKFPSDSTRIDKSVPFNVREILYPGMHSDVGGGYSRDSQEGRTNMLANIALCNLYFSAYSHGVPFKTPGEIQAKAGELFEISDELEMLFNNYWMEHVPSYSTLESGVVAHMRLYYHWRWGRTQRLKSGELLPKGGVDKWMKISDQEWEEDVISIAQANTGFFRSSLYDFQQDIFKAWRGELRKKLSHDKLKLFDGFFDKYLHDSIAGFKNQMDDGHVGWAENSRWSRNRFYFVGRNADKKYIYWQYAYWRNETSKTEVQVTKAHDQNQDSTAAV